jgi:hypothetical protein
METLALALVWFVQLYLLAGLVFAVAFVLGGVQRIDHAAAGTGWGFRLIILPGVVAFWPVLLRRWVRGAQPPEEQSEHRKRSRGAR